MKFAMTKAFAFMAGIGMCIAFTGCKDDDTRMPATDGGYSVEMEIELTPQGSDNSATPTEVTIVRLNLLPKAATIQRHLRRSP